MESRAVDARLRPRARRAARRSRSSATRSAPPAPSRRRSAGCVLARRAATRSLLPPHRLRRRARPRAPAAPLVREPRRARAGRRDRTRHDELLRLRRQQLHARARGRGVTRDDRGGGRVTLAVRVRGWAAWAPGLEEPEAWRRWAKDPAPLEREGVPDATFLPAMLRRRCTPLTTHHAARRVRRLLRERTAPRCAPSSRRATAASTSRSS